MTDRVSEPQPERAERADDVADDDLVVRCPHCETALHVDRGTGSVLEAHPPSTEGKDFDTLLGELDDQKARAERIFEQEKAAQADRSRLLEERFERALRRADDDDRGERPVRPIDLD